MRLFLRTEGCDGRRHGFRVVTLEGRDDFIIGLGRVEVFRDLVDPLTIGTAHCVPPLNLGNRRSDTGSAHKGGQRRR